MYLESATGFAELGRWIRNLLLLYYYIIIIVIIITIIIIEISYAFYDTTQNLEMKKKDMCDNIETKLEKHDWYQQSNSIVTQWKHCFNRQRKKLEKIQYDTTYARTHTPQLSSKCK